MSSESVRNAIKSAVETLAEPWQVFDASDYVSLDDMLRDISAHSVILQYIIADELPITVGNGAVHGFEESGTVTIHLVVPTGFDSEPVVQKGDEIRLGLRGRRLTTDLVIESCSPFVDFGGGFGVNGSVHGWASNLYYTQHSCD